MLFDVEIATVLFPVCFSLPSLFFPPHLPQQFFFNCLSITSCFLCLSLSFSSLFLSCLFYASSPSASSVLPLRPFLSSSPHFPLSISCLTVIFLSPSVLSFLPLCSNSFLIILPDFQFLYFSSSSASSI